MGSTNSSVKKVEGQRRLNLSLRMNLLMVWRPAGVPAPKVVGTLASEVDFSLVISKPNNGEQPYTLFCAFFSTECGWYELHHQELPGYLLMHRRAPFTGPVKASVTWKMNGDNNEYSATL